jgi:hypothetical protein
VAAVTCSACATRWAAGLRPCCPACLVAGWLRHPTLLTGKHDPRNLEAAHGEFRSILSDDVVSDVGRFLHAAVEIGTWYYHTEHEAFNHVTHMPLDHKPGSAVGAGHRQTSRRLEDLVVADADRDPHVFADGREATRRKIATGIYRPLEPCSMNDCDNLAQPRSRECAVHSDPPRALRIAR